MLGREVRDELEGRVSHTPAEDGRSLLDDASVSTRTIRDQLGPARVSMTQDRYLGRRPTDRETADVLEGMFSDESGPRSVPDLEVTTSSRDRDGA
jgi:hypothetical protein